MGCSCISIGGMVGMVVDVKILFCKVFYVEASVIIFCYNYFFGNLFFSQADLDFIKKLVKAGWVVDILVLDYFIVLECGYYSFVDEGKF